MNLVAYPHRISAEIVQQLLEGFWRVPRDIWWDYRGGTEEALAIETGEYLVGVGEIDRYVQTEEVGGVAGLGENVTGNLEGHPADEDVKVGFEELGDEFGHYKVWSVFMQADDAGRDTHGYRTVHQQTSAHNVQHR